MNHLEGYSRLSLDSNTVIRPTQTSSEEIVQSGNYLGLSPGSYTTVGPAGDLIGATLQQDASFAQQSHNMVWNTDVIQPGDVRVLQQQHGFPNHIPSFNLSQTPLPSDASRSISPHGQVSDPLDPNFVWIRVPRNDQILETPVFNEPSFYLHASSTDGSSSAGEAVMSQLDVAPHVPQSIHSSTLTQPKPRKKRQRNANARTRTGFKYRLVKCEECNEEYPRNILARHRRTHEPPQFRCQGCGAAKTRPEFLRAHNEKFTCANGIKERIKRKHKANQQVDLQNAHARS